VVEFYADFMGHVFSLTLFSNLRVDCRLVKFIGRVYGSSLWLISYESNFVSILQVVFLVRVYGRIYKLIVRVVFIVQVYGIR